jgi:hypothetical protein
VTETSELSAMNNRLLEELRRIQAARHSARPKHFRPSRLDPYRFQIEALAAAGASREDIRKWLRQHPRIEVNGSTISRALQRWKTQKP